MEACINDDMQIKKTYANTMGIPGETLCQSHGALGNIRLDCLKFGNAG